MPDRLMARVHWGLKWGVSIAAVFSAMAVGMWAASGFRPDDMVFFALIYYWIMAVIVGILLGVLKPLATRMAGAALVGFVISSAAHGGAGVWLYHTGRAELRTTIIAVLLLGFIIGVPSGVYVWNYERKNP